MLARSHLVLAAAALFALSACAGKQKAQPEETVAQAAGSKPTDAQIVAILTAANDADIAGGQQAEKMASSADVQGFGKEMVSDHTALNQRGSALAAKLGVTPEENDTSKKLREDGQKAAEKRQSLTGAAYDKQYLDDEIAFHLAVLQAIDQTLLPSAQNPELKALITEARPQIAAHLEHARTLRANLGQ
jgi:putative membrane protein